MLEFYKAFDKCDASLLDSMLTDDFRCHFPGEPQPLGRVEFKAYYLAFVGAFPDVKHTFEAVLVDGNLVSTRGHFTATHKGTFQGLPATGQEVKVNVMHVDRIENDQLLEHWGQVDLASFYEQMGITPLPLKALWKALQYRFTQ